MFKPTLKQIYRPYGRIRSMKEITRLRARALICAVALAFNLCACASSPPRTVKDEHPAAAAQPTPATQPTPAVAASPATASGPDTQPASTPAAPELKSPPEAPEVRAALERTYKGAVAFDERNAHAVASDFNGDGSEDLAVEVRATPNRVAELNDELSNWIVSDPLKVKPPDPREFDPHQGVQKLAPSTARPHVAPNDALLVIIHGYKESGWRNPEALQTYLLKNVAGKELKTQSRADAQTEVRNGIPRLLGDVIHEQLGADKGFLYWTGAAYGWFH
jgi:hypothetical protein